MMIVITEVTKEVQRALDDPYAFEVRVEGIEGVGVATDLADACDLAKLMTAQRS